MSRFARRRQRPKTVDLLTAGEDGPELLRVTLRRISSADAAQHGLHRILVLAEVTKQRPAHTPQVIREAQRLVGRLKGVRSDLSAYDGEQVKLARLHIDAVEFQLTEQLTEEGSGGEVEHPQQRREQREQRQARIQAAYESAAFPPALIRLLLAERKLAKQHSEAEHRIAQHEVGKMAGLARAVGSAGSRAGAEQRAAIVCAAVTHTQTLVPVAGVEALDPDNPEHWQPHPEEPHPEALQLCIDGEVDESSSPPRYPLALVFTSSEIAILGEAAYLHAVGGQEGRAALERFRRATPAAGGAVAPEQRQGANRG